MITEDYVRFETAKLLKEKGFVSDWCTKYYEIPIYDNGFNPLRDSDKLPKNYNFGNFYCSAPTLQMAMKWLREKHICIVIIPKLTNIESGCDYFAYSIWAGDNLEVDGEKEWDKLYSYEEAVEAAIKYVLENLI